MDDAKRFYAISPLSYTGSADMFTYHSDTPLQRGDIVTIPLGRRNSQGVVMNEVAKPAFKTRASGSSVIDTPLPDYLLDLATWMKTYYASSLSAIWTTMLPAGITKKRRGGLSSSSHSEMSPINLPTDTLTLEQSEALNFITHDPHTISLLHGITGSGKTRIYLELSAQALSQNRSVIILVPEITLAQQVVKQFEETFGERVISTHSKLTEAQRHRIWEQARYASVTDRSMIIVGPRSCLFLPLYHLGLIVVDEAHETSYKQDQHPRYQTMAVAAKLAAITSAHVVLGSATPGLTELAAAQSDRIGYTRLTTRANNIAPLAATIIDLRNKDLLKLSKFIAQPLFDAVSTTLSAGRQSLLYLNRRGSATSQICSDCGNVTICPNCQLPLTFHADWMRLVCHHCNYRQPSAAVCPVCNGANLRLLGGGTKRIEEESMRLWPHARIARLDRDSATISYIKTVFMGLRRGTIDIVIGTQMIAKGLDLPAIDTVGVVSADTMLHLPDYSAAERTFQLISQVSGRAGRGDRPGQVYIQTYTPDHLAITTAARGDYDTFATQELAERKLLHYPPDQYLLKLRYSGPTREDAIKATESFTNALRHHNELNVTGPAPAFIELQAERFHWVVTIKAKHRHVLVQVANQLPNDNWSADLDPNDLL